MSAHTPPTEIYASAAGAAQILTTSYVASAYQPAHPVMDFNQALLFFTIAGTAPTSVEWIVQYSRDGTNFWTENTIEVAGAAVSHRYEERNLPLNAVAPALTTGPAIHVSLGVPGTQFRIAAKRTGGDGTTSLLCYAQFGSER